MDTWQKATELLQIYASEKQRLWQEFPLADVAAAGDIMWQAYQGSRTVYGCGNGGNCGIVANMLNDFSTVPFLSDDKHTAAAAGPRLRTISLCDSPTAITAALNDLGPDKIFSEQLRMHSIARGDVLIALSGSGNSANVVAAADVARHNGATVIGISRDTGGKLRARADLMILISGTSRFPGQVGPNNFNFHYEDSASAIGHMITGLIKQRFTAHAHATPAAARA